MGDEAVNIAYGFRRQALGLVLRFFSLHSAALTHAAVELLEVVGGDFAQLDVCNFVIGNLIKKKSCVVG